jgi:hypothetical protein
MLARVGAILRRNDRLDAQAASGVRRVRDARSRARPGGASGGAWQRGGIDRSRSSICCTAGDPSGIVFNRAALAVEVWSDGAYVTGARVDTVGGACAKIERDAQDRRRSDGMGSAISL